MFVLHRDGQCVSHNLWTDKEFVIWRFFHCCFVQIVSSWSLSIRIHIIFATNEMVHKIDAELHHLQKFWWNSALKHMFFQRVQQQKNRPNIPEVLSDSSLMSHFQNFTGAKKKKSTSQFFIIGLQAIWLIFKITELVQSQILWEIVCFTGLLLFWDPKIFLRWFLTTPRYVWSLYMCLCVHVFLYVCCYHAICSYMCVCHTHTCVCVIWLLIKERVNWKGKIQTWWHLANISTRLKVHVFN